MLKWFPMLLISVVFYNLVIFGGDLFVPAGQIHRFEDFSSDFAVWVAFYGPEGGERVA